MDLKKNKLLKEFALRKMSHNVDTVAFIILILNV